MKFYRLIHLTCAVFLSIFAAQAQNQATTPEQREKQMLESIDREKTRLRDLLDLEYWQEFYVDSILTHDYAALTKELEDMAKAKVENTDLYQSVQDKWMQQIADSLQKIFTEEQWKQYMKSGGQRAQRDRDKRREKAAKASADRKK